MVNKEMLWLFWPALIGGMLFTGGSLAETPEQVINPKTAGNEWVSDMAGVIDHASESAINSLLNQLEQQTGVEIAVVTIHQSDGRTPKEFATELLNRWGIGKKGKDNGVLVLMVTEARRIEVETGYALEGVLSDGKVGAILDAEVIPRFRNGDIGGGLLAGVRAMAEAISREPGAAPADEASDRRSFSFHINIPVIPLLLILAGGLLLYYNYRAGIRNCPQCGKRMRRLSEEQDDAYLSFDQKFEEDLGSIDYRAWRCDDCAEMKIEKKVRWLSGYSECPKCKHRTLSSRTIQLLEPTYTREGMAEVVQTCRFPNCKYQYSKKQAIPRRVKLRSGGGWYVGGGGGGWSSGGGGGWSGGGSFGGGSSGGGGAGRSW